MLPPRLKSDCAIMSPFAPPIVAAAADSGRASADAAMCEGLRAADRSSDPHALVGSRCPEEAEPASKAAAEVAADGTGLLYVRQVKVNL